MLALSLLFGAGGGAAATILLLDGLSGGDITTQIRQTLVSEQSAIVAVAKEKMGDVLRDDATFQESDDRLSSGVVRVYKACERHEAPPSANAGGGVDLASIMQQIVASLGSVAGAAGASALAVPEGADDLKRVKHEEFVLKLVKRLQDAGEASLPRQDRITHTILWKLHKRLVEGGRVPDVEDGDNELAPSTSLLALTAPLKAPTIKIATA